MPESYSESSINEEEEFEELPSSSSSSKDDESEKENKIPPQPDPIEESESPSPLRIHKPNPRLAPPAARPKVKASNTRALGDSSRCQVINTYTM